MTKPFKWLEKHHSYEEVMEYMEEIPKEYWPFYSRGLHELDKWYGDKSYRQYDDWLDILSKTLKEIE